MRNPCVIVALALLTIGCPSKPGPGHDAAPKASTSAAPSTAPSPAVSAAADPPGAAKPGSKLESPPKIEEPFSAVFWRLKQERFKYESAAAFYTDEGIEVLLSTKPIDCDTQSVAGDWVSFLLPPGPKGSFFSGHPIGVNVVFHNPGLRTQASATFRNNVGPARVRLEVDRLDHQKDARIKGKLELHQEELTVVAAVPHFELTQGAGTFDAKVCGKPSKTLAAMFDARAEVPAKPVSGQEAGKPRTLGSALARVVKDPYLGEYVDRIDFTDHPVTCETDPTTFGVGIVVTRPGGAGPQLRFTGGAQPLRAIFHFDKAAPRDATGGSWIRIDTLDLAGGKVTGALFYDHRSIDKKLDVTFAGTFDATVCREK